MRTSRIVFTVIVFLCTVLSGVVFAEGSIDSCKQEAVEWIDANQQMFVDAAITIFKYAEIGLEEYRSSDYLADMLEMSGFTVERGVADMPTAFVASYGEGQPVVGILAEYDALPGLSQKPGLTHKDAIEQGAPGHGCGHNLFGSGSVSAAMAVKAIMEKNNISGTIKLFGCPAEETVIGKVYMAKAGIFDGLDACLFWHPANKNNVSMMTSLAMNNFEVTFRGKTAHGAADPWQGRSALDAVELMNIGVNFMREHVKPTVRIHYVIKNGGDAPNIVPDYACVWYFVRDTERKGVDEIYKRVVKCAEGASLMTETTMEVNLITGVHPLLSNKVLSSVLYKNLMLIGPPNFSKVEQEFAREVQRSLGLDEEGMSAVIEEFEEEAKGGGGSTDVAEVSWLVPTSTELRIASAPLEIPWHSWAVTTSSGYSVGHKSLLVAGKVLAASCIEVLMSPDIIKKAREEFEEKTRGFTYESAVPTDQKPPVPERKE